MIEPERFVKAVEFTKKADCKAYATIPSLTKMLGCSKMDVMEYIEYNPQLVHAEERFAPKTVTVTERIPGCRPYSHRETVRGRSYGLCIIEAYTKEEDNPWTEKWLEKTKERYAKTVWVSEWNNYGTIEGLYLSTSLRPSELKENEIYKDNRKNTFLWRNTVEKLKATKELGATYEATFYIGGAFDCSKHDMPYAINKEGIQLLRENGWTVIE